MNADLDLYYSVKLRRNMSESSVRVPPGAAHYSYSAVAGKFVPVFRDVGMPPVELDRPEIYMAPPLAPDRRSVHVMFKPYEEFRLLRGACNIAHVAWEFEELPRRELWKVGDARRDNPFNDYLHMLRIPDRVWVGCRFTKDVFSKFGVNNVDLVPAPIASGAESAVELAETRAQRARLARLRLENVKAVQLTERLMRNPESLVLREHTVAASSLIRRERNLFLLVANPGDLRKNLPAVIDGASLAAQRDPGIVLIIKLVIDNKHMTVSDFIKRLPSLYRNVELDCGDIAPTNIFLIHDFLSPEELQALYACCQFYLTATVAEGQNLPLQEAMASGSIPVAPNHTAMADYVSDGNGVLIKWEMRDAPYAFSEAYGLRDLNLAYIAPQAVATAVADAAGLSKQDRLHKAEAAMRIIRDQYSPSVIAQTVSRLIDDC